MGTCLQRVLRLPLPLVLFWLWLCPGPARAAEGEDAAQFFVVQSRLDNNNRRKEKLEAEIESLERTRERIDGAVKQLKALSFDRARSQAALERLLAKLPKAAGRGAAFDIKSASDELLQLVLPPLVRRSPRPSGDPLADQLVAGLEAHESVPFSPPLEVAEGDLRRHLEALSRNAASARDTAAEALGGAERLPALLTSLERIAAAARAGRQAEAQGYLERVEAGLKSRRAELAKLGEDIQQLGAQLASRGARDHYLTYAIFAMIGMLFALVLLFAFFRERVQERIVERRTLVELVGLAFLMLTIIILGTGEKIGKDVLGTLLGTIAGYIFGQNRSAREREGAMPAEPSPDPQRPLPKNVT